MDLTDDYPWFHYRIYLYICSALSWTANFLKTEIHLVHALKVSCEASYTASTRSISRSDLTARHWECLGQTWEQGSLTRDFSSVLARFYILWLLGFLSWNWLETGVYRTNCFQMNSDLQLIDEVQQKSQKSSLCTVYPGTSFNHTFIRNTAWHADPPDNLPPCESPLLPSLIYS